MQTINHINTIEDCYNNLKVKEYWEQPNYDVCGRIIEFLDNYIQKDPGNARAYYLRAMAKFSLLILVLPEDFCYKNLPENSAWDDYQNAVKLDANIVANTPEVRVITSSASTGLKYYFRKPCPERVLKKITAGNNIIGKLSAICKFLAIISFIILFTNKYFLPGLNDTPFIILLLISLSIIWVLSTGKIPDKLSNKYCEKIVQATYEEIK